MKGSFKSAIPHTIVSVLSAGTAQVTAGNPEWTIEVTGSRVKFGMAEGCFTSVAVENKA
jgi:hypothetical protein